LLLGSIFSGAYLKDLLSGTGSDFFRQSIYIGSTHLHNDQEYLNYLLKNIPFIGTMLGLTAGFLFNKLIYILISFNILKKNSPTPITYKHNKI